MRFLTLVSLLIPTVPRPDRRSEPRREEALPAWEGTPAERQNFQEQARREAFRSAGFLPRI